MIDFIAGVLVGMAVCSYLFNTLFTLGRKLPYRWECDFEGCVFDVSTDNPDPQMLMNVIQDHKEGHVRE